MKLIIDINDNEYIGIKEYPDNVTSYPVTIHLYDAVRNGVPLKDEVMLATLLSLVADKDYKPKLEGEQE